MAWDSLKGFTGWIRITLVVTGNHPDFPSAFNPNLGRAENVFCRMKGNMSITNGYFLSVSDGLDMIANPQSQWQFSWFSTEI
jgi:hypothetical protein